MTIRLAQLTTLRVGGPAADLVEARSGEELVEAVAKADADATPVLVLGGGSNVLIADEGFPGRVVHVRSRGITMVDCSDCGGAVVDLAAGERWDDVVARAVGEGWKGIEALSGIPGSVGATPIQNVGAYGQQVADVVASVRAYDRVAKETVTLPAAACGFGYRSSRFKSDPARHVVLSVRLQLERGEMSMPVAYPELARDLATRLGQPDFGVGGRAPMPVVREAVLAIRARKGMVLDPADPDTWSAGSFFTNPQLTPDDAERLPPDAPRYPGDHGRVKTSAAWLIERAGFARGYGSGAARLSSKHTLALTNRGSATAADLVALAREIRDGVWERFGVRLVPEPVLVGLSLDDA